MKRTNLGPILLLFAFGVLFNEQATCQSAEISINTDSSPLTSDAIQSAFSVLGLNIERFVYETPFKHRIRLALLEYRKGKLQKPQAELPVAMDAGKQLLVLYVHDNEDKIDISIESNRRRNSLGTVALRGLNAKTWRTFENAKVKMSTFDTSESLDVTASKYDLFIVVTAQLERE